MMKSWPFIHLVLFLSLIFALGTGCGDEGDAGPCLKEDSNACAQAKASCVATCIADEICLSDCQIDFCDCMDAAGCAPPAECKE